MVDRARVAGGLRQSVLRTASTGPKARKDLRELGAEAVNYVVTVFYLRGGGVFGRWPAIRNRCKDILDVIAEPWGSAFQNS